MDNKHDVQHLTGEMYPSFPSQMYYSVPVSAPASQPPSESLSGAPTTVPVKLISQGSTQIAYLSLAAPGTANIDPMMFAHLPAIQFTSGNGVTIGTSPEIHASATTAEISEDHEQLVNHGTEEPAATPTPKGDQFPQRLVRFLILSLMAIGVAAFFFIHTTVLSNSNRMMFSRCTGSSSNCYTWPMEYLIVPLKGFGYTAASASVLVALISLLQGVIKQKSALKVVSILSLLFEAMTTVFFLAGFIYFALDTYYYGVDTFMGYLVGFLVHIFVLIVDVYSFKKQMNISSSVINAAIIGICVSGFNILLSIGGLAFTGFLYVWAYTTAPAIIFLLANVAGLIAYAMLVSKQKKNMKVVSTLLKIAAAANWMMVGIAVFVIALAFFGPVLLAVAVPVSVIAIPSALHASYLSDKLLKN